MFGKTIVLACSLTLGFGCRSSGAEQAPPSETEAKSPLKKVTIAEVSQFVQKKSAAILDANSSETRQEYGVIPGAILLSSHETFAVTELPQNKSMKLVFYCGSLSCTASHVAAARATAAGYTDVTVLPDGIRGWKKAGQPTEQPQS
jgi:rhodanese-related sulfurtransferase